MRRAQRGQFPCRVEGWLKICDKETMTVAPPGGSRWQNNYNSNNNHNSNNYRQQQQRRGAAIGSQQQHGALQVAWKPYYCVLLQDDRILTHYLTEEMSLGDRGPGLDLLPRLRLDGGRQNYRRRWGGDLSGPPPLPEEDEDSELSETTSLRDERMLRFSPLEVDEAEKFNRRHTIGVHPCRLEEEELSCDLRTVTDDLLTTLNGDEIGQKELLFRESSYEKACSETGGGQPRRGSAPTTPVLGPRAMDNAAATPSRFANFFSKRSFKSNPLKRTKSVTKLERKRGALDGDSILPSRLRTSRSHESLLQSSPSTLASLDLSHGDVQVSSIHDSLLGQEHCFQLSSNAGTRYYTCRTSEERDRWVYNLKKTIQPNQDNVRRTENTLRIWILEAKGIAGKKRYFCELCLDKTLYARTSSKQKSDICFWGENFEFNNLPRVETITVHLYREADKKKRRDKNTLVGTLTIPIQSVNSRHFTEKWYPVTTEKLSGGKDTPALRIKTRYQSIDILPLIVYRDFIQYVKKEYKVLCEMMEPAIGVRTKEDIAVTLVHIMQQEGVARQFLADIVMQDVDKIDDHHLTFRGNSLATKAMEAYMKLLGEKYLQDTLGDFVRAMLASGEDCEVDPTKVTGTNNNNSITTLQRQQANLMAAVEMAWLKIINSSICFPMELRQVFHEYRERLKVMGKETLGENLISASIFLRFLCPAILSPSLFNLTQEYPQTKAGRNLTLIAKTIQTLANFTKFGGKESFMEFMNEFVEREWSTMKLFLKQISSPPSKEQLQMRTCLEFDGHVDVGRELAMLHGLLVDCISRINKKMYFKQVEALEQILDGISAALIHPNSSQHPHPASADIPQNSENRFFPHSLQRTSPAQNDASDKENNQPPSSGGRKDLAGQRSNTLPWNAYLLGSSKQPARDLTTADDYVLFSALEGTKELEEKGQRCREPVYVRDTFSKLTLSCIYGEALIGAPGSGRDASRRFHSDSENKSRTPRHQGCNSGGTDYSGAGEEDAANSSGEMEYPANTTRGSQISISQLSTVASSGYQSIAYSQSSSPVDSVIQQDRLNGNIQHSSGGIPPPPPPPPPLAFNNPMYHFNKMGKGQLHVDTNRGRPVSSPCGSLSSSRSVDDIPSVAKKGLVPESSPGLCDCGPSTCNCCYTSTTSTASSSSSSNLSCSSSPPRERRSSAPFKSQAPRTNPHYSGSQPSALNAIGSEQPRLSLYHANCQHSHHHRGHHNHFSELQDNQQQLLSRQRLLRRTSAESIFGMEKQSPPEDAWDSEPQEVSYIHQQQQQQRSQEKRRSQRKTRTHKTRQEVKDKGARRSLEEYEHQVSEMQLLMSDLQQKLNEAQGKLVAQESVTEQAVADWRARLEAGEERLRRQQEDKDNQMKSIITRLITVEEELRKEQQEMAGVISSKQKVIDAQERRIHTLDAANARLMSALSQLKERYQLQPGRNGTNTPAMKMALVENGTELGYKSSSC